MDQRAHGFGLGFADARLKTVHELICEQMVKKQGVSLRRLGEGRATEVRFGRFMNNDRVGLGALVEEACRHTDGRSSGRHVLAIQDTSELNFQAHSKRVKGLGTVGNGSDMGLFVHPVLAVDAHEGACLGLADVLVWQRLKGKAENYRSLPIEEKESLRWIIAAQAGGRRLKSAQSVTVVADRESDIYEAWARLPDRRTHLLVRACRDRAVEADVPHGGLFEWMSSLPVQGSYHVRLPAVAGKRAARDAVLQVRFSPVSIKRPKECSDKAAPASVQLWAIDVFENNPDLDDQDDLIHWRLLTTHPVETLEMALQCIEWYRQRWNIEQLFRTLKSDGLDVESSELETAAGLEKMAILALTAATRIMQLTLARDGSSRPATDAFDAQEIEVLERVVPTLEGKTVKQKNPYPSASLAWAAWAIARLGGWKGYASERKPGPITMSNGLKRFTAMCDGWRLLRG
jgi:hypothetical protein